MLKIKKTSESGLITENSDTNFNCFCGCSFEEDASIRLGCGCILHSDCFNQYINSKISDRIQLINACRQMQNKGLPCPYYSQAYSDCKFKKLKKDDSNIYCITMDSLKEYIELQKVILSKSLGIPNIEEIILTPETHFTLEKHNIVSNWILEDLDGIIPKSTEPIYISDLTEEEKIKRSDELSDTKKFIDITTAACPKCSFRISRWHGHACHHISPGRGCPNCREHYCIVCGGSETENREERGSASKCRCRSGYWSSFCGRITEEDLDKGLLSLVPYPHDTRCGCAICPDCAYGVRCELCNGDCVVCKGYINPGPKERSSNWLPYTAKSLSRNPAKLAWYEFLIACKTTNKKDIYNKMIKLNGGYDINTRDLYNNTGLLYACQVGDIHILKMLKVHSASITVLNNELNSPMMVSALHDKYECIYELLTFDNANSILNVFNSNGKSLLTILMERKAPMQLIEYLLRFVDLHAKDRYECGYLHVVNKLNNYELFTLLFQYCKTPEFNTLNMDGLTPFGLACRYSRTDLVLSMLPFVDCNLSSNYITNPLVMLINSENERLACKLLLVEGIQTDLVDADGNTLLMIAIMKGKWEVFHSLLQLDSTIKSLNSMNTNAECALSMLIESDQYTLLTILFGMNELQVPDNLYSSIASNSEIFQMLISSGKSVDWYKMLSMLCRQSNYEGFMQCLACTSKYTIDYTGIITSLLIYNEVGIVCSMIELGYININSSINTGSTILMFLIERNLNEYLERMLEFGVPAGNTLEIAIKSKNMLACQLLLKYDTQPKTGYMLAGQYGFTELIPILITISTDKINDYYEGYTALMYACKHGQSKTIMELLKIEGIDIHCKSVEGLACKGLDIGKKASVLYMPTKPLDMKVLAKLNVKQK